MDIACIVQSADRIIVWSSPRTVLETSPSAHSVKLPEPDVPIGKFLGKFSTLRPTQRYEEGLESGERRARKRWWR